MSSQPALFVSHGAPTLIITPGAARDFLAGLGQEIPHARAALAVSAHWETSEPTVSLAQKPETIHDFSGFPRELYAIQYPAPGVVDLRELDWSGPAAPPSWVSDFSDWVAGASERGSIDQLLRYREDAPAAARNHPTEEHFLPFFVALGAGSTPARASRIHVSTTFGVLAMDAYRFD